MSTAVQTQVADRSTVAVRVGWISLFAILTGLGAWIKIPLPFTPVPITLQTAAVLASGVVLGRDGLYAQLLYLLLGGIGLPMFAGAHSNLLYLFGATGGYLIGFVASAALTGSWIHPRWRQLTFWGRSWRLIFVSLVLFIPGVLQLKLFTGMDCSKALLTGFVFFIPGDILKVFAVSVLPNRAIRTL
ncbi:MAG TPA: biotin transporter BioY [Bdellovibrionota bacterium]|nr:biotin transporter BioY [Bdellovibrionota bacterium]